MAQVVNDLVTKFSFDGSPAPLKNFNTDLKTSIKMTAGFIVGMNAMATAFFAWSDSVLTGVDSLSALSKQTGVSVSKIQELGFIAEQNQSSVGAMESTIQSLSSAIGTAAQQGSEDFSRLGISVRDASGQVKTADKVLDEIRGRFIDLKLSIQEQEHFASALGIDSSLIQMMGRTNSEIEALTKRARQFGTLTAEQVEQSDLYKKSLNEMFFGLNSIKQIIAVGVAPEMANMAKNFIDLLTRNKDWIVDGIKASIEWIGNFLAMVNRLLPFMALVATGFAVAKVAALGFSGVMGILLSPVALITAGIVGLALIVDDLIVAFDGGKSIIASFFKDAFDIDIVNELKMAINFVSESINSLIKDLQTIGKLWDDVVSGRISKGNLFSGIFGIGEGSGSNIGQGNNNFAIPPASPATSFRNDNRQVNQSNTINVSTNEPEAAARAINDGLQRQLDNANIQFGVGGI